MENGSRISVVNETNLGMYVWKINGKYVSDEDGNVMNVVCMRGDLEKLGKLREAAEYYGAGEGQPVFLEGARRITAEEHAEQTQRMKDGQIPDAQDIGNYKDMQRGFFTK